MSFIEDSNFLKDKHKTYINNVILGNNFPYYYQTNDIADGTGDSFLCHVVLSRPEERNNTDGINSPHFNFFKDLLETFCKKHNMKVIEIYRIAVNLTFYTGNPTSLPHVDHVFDHKQLIIYLNNPKDKKSNTVVSNKNKQIIKEVSPKKYKGFCFDNSLHYLRYPKKGERILAIITFNADL